VIEEGVSCCVEFEGGLCQSGIEGFESLVDEAEPAIVDSEIVILDSAFVLIDCGRVLGQHDWTRAGGM
jgi:hypothetical protein